MTEVKSYKQICELIDTISTTAADFKKFYRVGDDKVFIVAFDLYQSINRVRKLRRGSQTYVRPANEGRVMIQWVVDSKNDGLDIGDLSPKELMHLAEYRAIVDNWIKGEFAELPPSNCAEPKRGDEE